MKKLLITGGAGFIGSHTVFEAIKKDYDVFNLDALTYAANLKNLTKIENKSNYHFIKGDIRDLSLLTKIFTKEKFDYVMHLAAESHVDLSIKNPNIFVETNVIGTHNLLECAKKFNIKKFLHVSTDEVYGDLTLDEPEFTEKSMIKPNSPYSASKAGSDLLVRSYVNTFGLNACITRCSNNYGPHQDLSKLIPVIISKALKNESIPVYGQGENVRDWLYVKDHVSALFTVLEKGKSGEVYNIGGNNEQKNIDIVKKILKILEKNENLIEFVTDRPGHDFRYAINSSKIQTELNWQPSNQFEDFLQETITWYQKNI